ncbi:hypothetical protein KP509_15G062200 [Ceratopteris richardii]|uniref:Uncharacterized protein n=1 Tax=Ceratopteris richardii TaxID=49495 RepID=A0A8T2T5C1_CERRI|nr:hypothetical protein KP509_15G062200 [Ceratopteris richardii]
MYPYMKDTNHPLTDAQSHPIDNERDSSSQRPWEHLYMFADESADADVITMIDTLNLLSNNQHSNCSTKYAADTSKPSVSGVVSNTLLPYACEQDLLENAMLSGRSAPLITDGALRKEDMLRPLKKHASFTLNRNGLNRRRHEFQKQQNFELFRTRSKLSEGKFSRIHSRKEHAQEKGQNLISNENDRITDEAGEDTISADRYFDALEGPELDVPKDSEDLLLPHDKQWPFLLRFPIVAFSICLGLSSQAVLWKMVAMSPALGFLHVPGEVNYALWSLALFSLCIVSSIYICKCWFYFQAVKPPPRIATTIHPIVWCVLVSPLLVLELKVYGQWLSGGKRRLSLVANASTHVAVMGNFLAAVLAREVGWMEPAVFFMAVGCAHYLVLFVTLYQRLPTAQTLPKELHPVFFFFVATPSTASVAWAIVAGNFNTIAKMIYFLALFLFLSLIARARFFYGLRFSTAWWAYTYPMTALTSATVHYSMAVRHRFTQLLAVLLLAVASLTVLIVFAFTIYHLILGTLFPNDTAIAITTKRLVRQVPWRGALNGEQSLSNNYNHQLETDDDDEKISQRGAK